MNYKVILIILMIMKLDIIALDFTASHFVTPNKVAVGEQVRLSIIVTANKKTSVQLNTVGKKYGVFRVVNEKIERLSEGDNLITKYNYMLGLYSLEKPIVPTTTITLKNANAQKTHILPAIPLTFKSNITENDQDLKVLNEPLDISIVRVMKESINWKVVGVLILIIVVLAYLLIKFWPKKKAFLTKQKLMPIDNRTPEERANESLKHLLSDNLFPSQIKQHYLRLSEIVKEYLSNRYNEKFIEMTTTEILANIKSKLSEQALNKIVEILSLADLVKFARYNPSSQEHGQANQRTKDVITIIQEQFKTLEESKPT